MAPITVQAARLASRQVLRAPLRQQVFRRYASSNAPADWGRIVKTRAQTLAIYLPGMAMVLGWPWIGAKVLGA